MLRIPTGTTGVTFAGVITATSPSFTTPVLGTPSSGNLSNCTAYEGSAVLSTGEGGGTKFLREDGDGTCSWQAPAGGGDLLADGSVPLTANWDVGAFTITGTQFISDIATGTAPFVVSSTTEVSNLKSATVGTITGLAPDTATTQAAQPNITSVGTLTALTVDDITINGNTISSGGASTLAITPTAGQSITFDGTVTLDAGVIAGATSITSTAFVGDLTGNADTVTTNANLTGHVTSTGNAAILGSFTKAQLNTAISDGIALNDVVDDTSPQLGAELDCNGFGLTDVQSIKIDATPDADHTATGPQTDTIAAGMSVSAFEIVVLQADGKFDKSDASAVATAQGMCGIALEAGTDTNPMLVGLAGSFVRDDTWAWTVGAELFMSLTAGAITETKPSATTEIVRMIGHAVSADVIYFNPDNTYLEIT